MPNTLIPIPPSDLQGTQQADALLEREGLRRDAHLDYTCGIFDGDWQLIATGSCFGRSLRCLAVNCARRGEGLMGQIIGHLAQVQAQRGNTRLYLVTRPQSAPAFVRLGFHEAVAAESAVLMENRRGGWTGFCAALPTPVPSRAAALVADPCALPPDFPHLLARLSAAHSAVHLFLLDREDGTFPTAWARLQVVAERLPNVTCRASGPYLLPDRVFPTYFLPDEDTAARVHARLDRMVFARLSPALGLTAVYSAAPGSGEYHRVLGAALEELGLAYIPVAKL